MGAPGVSDGWADGEANEVAVISEEGSTRAVAGSCPQPATSAIMIATTAVDAGCMRPH